MKISKANKEKNQTKSFKLTLNRKILKDKKKIIDIY